MKNRLFAAIALAALSTGAFAQQAPVAGEGPVFTPVYAASSSVSRDAVRAQAVAKAQNGMNPGRDASDANVQWNSRVQSVATRAEMRQQTREAIAHGLKVSVGEQS